MNYSHIQHTDLGFLISNLEVVSEKRCHEERAFNVGRDGDGWWPDRFDGADPGRWVIASES